MTYKRITPQHADFDGCPHYKKTRTLDLKDIVIAKGDEIIETSHKDDAGHTYTETTRTANKGDYIITRPNKDNNNDRYILSPAQFKKNYTISPDNKNHYISNNTGPAFQISEDIVLTASFGTDQYIKAGGYIYWNKSTDEIYGNQQHSFESDFVKT